MAEDGDKGAAVALELANSPTRFLSTVQLGITLVGVFAGAFGGAHIASRLALTFVSVPFVGPYATQISFFLVVLVITLFSLIIGELIPKRIALNSPEVISPSLPGPCAAFPRSPSPGEFTERFRRETPRSHGHRQTPGKSGLGGRGPRSD